MQTFALAYALLNFKVYRMTNEGKFIHVPGTPINGDKHAKL